MLNNVRGDLSAEDEEKRPMLESCLESLRSPKGQDIKEGLVRLRDAIQEATSSMTAIPVPLKFLAPHYEEMKLIFSRMKAGNNKKMFADIMSVIGMTDSKEDTSDCLDYKLQGNVSIEDCQ